MSADFTPLDSVLLSARSDLKSTEEELRRQASYLIRDMEAVIRNLDAGYNVNSLGELQGRGVAFDRLCALRQERAESIRRLEWLQSKQAEQAEAGA